MELIVFMGVVWLGCVGRTVSVAGFVAVGWAMWE